MHRKAIHFIYQLYLTISIVMKTEIATGATIKAVEGFDAAALKKAETVEKNSLPDQEGMII